MKKTISAILIGATLITGAMPIYANQFSSKVEEKLVATDGGERIVECGKGSIGIMAANHVTGDACGGGDWYWGYDGDIVFSDYSHKTLYHSATVITDLGKDKEYRYPDGTFNDYACAEKKTNGEGTNKVYWNTYE